MGFVCKNSMPSLPPLLISSCSSYPDGNAGRAFRTRSGSLASVRRCQFSPRLGAQAKEGWGVLGWCSREDGLPLWPFLPPGG